MSYAITFETKSGLHDEQPAFFISSVSDGREQVEFLRFEQTDTSFDIDLTAWQTTRVIEAIKRTRQLRDRHQQVNCVRFASMVLDVEPESEEDALHGVRGRWALRKSTYSDLETFDSGLLLPRIERRTCEFSEGHQFIALGDCDMALHVDGMGGPLLISPLDSVKKSYWRKYFSLHKALPAPAFESYTDCATDFPSLLR